MEKGAKAVGESGDSAASAGGQEFIIGDIKIPSFLKNCRPQPDVLCYIHVIKMKTEYKMPQEHRKQGFYTLMGSNQCCFGIVTCTPLLQICSFPVWSDLGQVRIRLKNNHISTQFSNGELAAIREFHKFLFMDVVAKVKKCFVFDTESSSNSFYIIPLKKTKSNDCSEISIAWSVIRYGTGIKLNPPSGPEDYSDENYAFKVVTPWYRGQNDIPLFYVITDTHTGKYMHSKMDLKSETFSEYFRKKYKLQAKQEHIQLFEARMMTNILESIRPRAIASSAKLKKRKKRDFQTFFHPEFVTKQKFPAILWYKSTLLPSILHRMQYLLLAEEVRQTIVKEAKVGIIFIPTDSVQERSYFIETNPMENNQMDAVEGQNVNTRASNQNTYENGQGDRVELQEVPHLSVFEDRVLCGGPTHYNILEALTLQGAYDTICQERLETLGDCYLKFITSFSIFVRQPNMKEGDMTKLRSQLIGNNNLTACGLKHEISSYIQATKFTAESSWIAPSFRVPAEICGTLLPASVYSKEFSNIIPSKGHGKRFGGCKLGQLLRVCLPEEERLTGVVSTKTINVAKECLEINANESKQERDTALYYMGKHEISVKNVADTVEALIGVYLQKCGIHGAFRVAKYLGIIKDEDYPSLMASGVPIIVSPDKMNAVRCMLPHYHDIEDFLQYEFRDKALLLEAFTDPSCLTNELTGCYQRLEFVGDAVLDFLITSYIYEYCGQLTPGQITDLRSALVNNTIFGALSVRLGLHKYLINPADSVGSAVASFATYQETKNHAIIGNELMIEWKPANSVPLAEEVKVPKVLADVFEALAGAIFVDSGYNLKLLWKIYYNIMKEEIREFSKCIPINPVRALYEKDKDVIFEYIGKAYSDDVIKAIVNVEGQKKEFLSRGSNSYYAKRAAAKLALKSIGYSKFVI